MCQLFAHQPQRDYESQTRSLRIGGHCTSIRVEMSFWDTLEEIAAKENMSLGKFLTTLHNEVLDHHGEVKNFASLLRCSCLIYRAKSVAALPEFRGTPAAILDAAECSRSHCDDQSGSAPLRAEPLHSRTVRSLSSALLPQCSPPAGSRAKRWSALGYTPRRW